MQHLLQQEVTGAGQETLLNMKELKAQLETFLDFNELTEYQITENFPKNGKRTYSVHNLEAEIEKNGKDTIVIFDDMEHKLKDDLTRVLNVFGARSVLEINQGWNDSWKAIIIFEDGTICIERVRAIN